MFLFSRKGWDHFQLGESFEDLVVLEVSDRTIESTQGIRNNIMRDVDRVAHPSEERVNLLFHLRGKKTKQGRKQRREKEIV